MTQPNFEEQCGKIKEKLGLAIGEASMLWTELPGGVFKSDRAVELVNELSLIVTTALRTSYIAGLREAANEVGMCGRILNGVDIHSAKIIEKSITARADELEGRCSG